MLWSQMNKVYYTIAKKKKLFQIPQTADSSKILKKMSLRKTKYEKKEAVQRNYRAVNVVALLMDTVRCPAQ